MKILVIASIPTPPITAGNSKCILEYCKMLTDNGAEVYYLYVEGKTKQTIAQRKELCEFWGERLYIFKRKLWLESVPRFVKLLRSKLRGYNQVDDLYPLGLSSFVGSIQKKEHFNAVIVNYITLSRLFTTGHPYKKILYTHDVFAYKKQRLGLNNFWYDLTPNEEAKGLIRADCILSIQENESIYYSYLCPQKPIFTAYSYFHIEQLPVVGNMNILFLAGNNKVNENGIRWFIDNSFKLITKKLPLAKLIIGGSICNVLEENENIKLIGRVDKEIDFYRLGDIVINPIFQGTGLKIKTFEALSFGKVTVVHPHSTEGIFCRNEAPVIVSEKPEEMADKIIDVLTHVEIRKDISKAAIEYMKRLNQHVKSAFIEAIS